MKRSFPISRYFLFHSVAETSSGDGMVIGKSEFDGFVSGIRHASRVGVATRVTFDDGYRDNLLLAAEVLRKHRQPATFFISGNAHNHQEPFWWDEIPRLIDKAEGEQLELLVESRRVVIDTRTPAGRDRAKRYCTKSLRSSTPAVLAAVREHLRSVAPDVRDDCPARLREDEIQQLASDPLFEVGGHTSDHAFLSSLSGAEVTHQIESNLDWLEEVTGTRPQTFAYPFGNRPSINDLVVETARQCGLREAFVNWPGLRTPLTDPMRIPRSIGR